jgi:hypothetical protein
LQKPPIPKPWMHELPAGAHSATSHYGSSRIMIAIMQRFLRSPVVPAKNVANLWTQYGAENAYHTGVHAF